jgi:hypothetical protein
MVDGVKAKTYQIACNWLGLLVDNYLYNKALVEASAAQTGYQLAEIFAIMCFHSPPADAKTFFETHYLAFTDNVARLDVTDQNSRLLRNSERRVLGLFRFKGIMAQMEHTLDECGIFISRADTRALNGLEMEKAGEKNPTSVKERLSKRRNMFNDGQKGLFNAVKMALTKRQARLFYLDGPGEDGKTFLLNTVIDLASAR